MAGPILITGAGGKTGRALIAALAERGAAVRAFVRTPNRADELIQLGAAEAVTGDLTRPADLARAAAGAAALYHIPPNMHPAEARIGRSVIRAAQTAGVRRIVYHSVLHPQTRRMPHHWRKLRVEELLFESGLSYTILQPAVYMQNILAGWAGIVQEGVYRVPYPAAARISLVDLADVAEAAAAVLLSDAYHAGTYELAGTPPLSQAEVAAAAGAALGRRVVVEEIPLDAWEARARAGGALSDYAVRTLLAMFRYYAAFGLEGNPNTLRQILGREPGSLAAFFARSV